MDFQLAKKGREILKMSLDRDPTTEEMIGFAALFNCHWLKGIVNSVLEKPVGDTQLMGYAATVECCLIDSLDKLAMTDKAMEAASEFHSTVQEIVQMMVFAGSQYFTQIIPNVPSHLLLTNAAMVHSIFMVMSERLGIKHELVGFMEKHPNKSPAFTNMGLRIALLTMQVKVVDMLEVDVLSKILVKGPCLCPRCQDILACVSDESWADHQKVFTKLMA